MIDLNERQWLIEHSKIQDGRNNRKGICREIKNPL
jgi:hypothetical protein